MIGADSNVLLRIVLDDDPIQGNLVRLRVERALNEGETIHIGPVALVETVWTLARRSKSPKVAVVSALTSFLETPPFQTFDDSLVAHALSLYANSQADFSDCLIHAMDQQAGCHTTITFDQVALSLPGFAHPSAA